MTQKFEYLLLDLEKSSKRPIRTLASFTSAKKVFRAYLKSKVKTGYMAILHIDSGLRFQVGSVEELAGMQYFIKRVEKK
jgi:hypothetical protein